jgi:hypothetical protein
MADSARSVVRRAVVIGIDRYDGAAAWNQLGGCVNDAVEIHDFLVGRVGLAAAEVELLLAPAPDWRPPAGIAVPTDVRSATAADIRAAFARLAEADGIDEAIIFYAGHGVRVARERTGEYVYGMVPADAGAGPDAFGNLVLAHTLHDLVQRLLARGVTPTVIADTCHSAGSLRAGDRARRLVPPGGELAWTLDEAAWQRLAPAARRGGDRGGSGWLDGVASNDWVMLAACRDTESAEEYSRERATANGVAAVRHGKLTGALLAALERVPASAVATLRWMDLFPAVRRRVGELGAQTPTLEGRPERPVFGGAWTPFPPGFAVAVRDTSGMLDVAAGLLHGVDEGAELAVGPAPSIGTAGSPVARAVVERATAAASTARVVGDVAIAEGCRAVLTRPGPRVPPVRALIDADAAAGLGPVAIAALHRGAAASRAVEIVAEAPADIDVRRFFDGRWVLVPVTAPAAVTADDVIAYLPAAASPDAHEALGAALAAGLAHWARYLRIRDRANCDATLMSLVEVHLRVGDDGAPGAEMCPRQVPDAAGDHAAAEHAPIWVELAIRTVPPFPVSVGLILCSDDGNVIPLWPPSGAAPLLGALGRTEWHLPPGQTLFIGRDRFKAAYPVVRDDQQTGRYVFKVIACTVVDGRVPDLGGLALTETVQDVIDAAYRDVGSRDMTPLPRVPPTLWCTWDLSVRVARRG